MSGPEGSSADLRRYVHWVPGVRAMKLIARLHTTLYRATRGAIGARADGLDMLLLTTRGRRSGRPRTTPLPFFRVGDDLVLIASFGGNESNPHWYGNLLREPAVRIRYRGRAGGFQARVTRAGERDQLWQEITREHPRYAEYQQRTARQIPVVVLSGAGSLCA